MLLGESGSGAADLASCTSAPGVPKEQATYQGLSHAPGGSMVTRGMTEVAATWPGPSRVGWGLFPTPSPIEAGPREVCPGGQGWESGSLPCREDQQLPVLNSPGISCRERAPCLGGAVGGSRSGLGALPAQEDLHVLLGALWTGVWLQELGRLCLSWSSQGSAGSSWGLGAVSRPFPSVEWACAQKFPCSTLQVASPKCPLLWSPQGP